jgi:four helix bundle protein
MRSYKDLLVWQKGMDLLVEVYATTKAYPLEERYGLAAHTRRTAVSIPSNIAEGYARHSRAEYVRYIEIAYASLAELETQLIAARRLKFLSTDKGRVFALLAEEERMLSSLRHRLRSRSSKTPAT